jgi:tryptophan 2,3-dioxygenase
MTNSIDTVDADARTDTDAPDLEYAGRTPYVAYTGSDILAALIKPQTTEPLEVTFIVATQITELHFNLLRYEWQRAIDCLKTDDLPEAMSALRRSLVAQDSLIRTWDLIAGMTPVHYNRFREALGKASGFQSFTYRELEFLIGAKSAGMLNPHSGMPDIRARLQRTYDAPSLYDTALNYLHRRGLPLPAAVLERDVREAWFVSHPEVVESWRLVYEREDELTEFADVLTAIAEKHSTWRFIHYTSVCRILGAKPGTGGSSGMIWLKRAVDTPIFVDLWDVRSVL